MEREFVTLKITRAVRKAIKLLAAECDIEMAEMGAKIIEEGMKVLIAKGAPANLELGSGKAEVLIDSEPKQPYDEHVLRIEIPTDSLKWHELLRHICERNTPLAAPFVKRTLEDMAKVTDLEDSLNAPPYAPGGKGSGRKQQIRK